MDFTVASLDGGQFQYYWKVETRWFDSCMETQILHVVEARHPFDGHFLDCLDVAVEDVGGSWESVRVQVPILKLLEIAIVLELQDLAILVGNLVLNLEILLEFIVIFDHLVSSPLEVVNEGTGTFLL